MGRGECIQFVLTVVHSTAVLRSMKVGCYVSDRGTCVEVCGAPDARVAHMQWRPRVRTTVLAAWPWCLDLNCPQCRAGLRGAGQSRWTTMLLARSVGQVR